MKPANQLKSVIKQGCFKLGLKTGTTSGKDSFNSSVKPKFILAFNANIFFKPTILKCSPCFIKEYASLNSKKSAFFF